MSQIKYTPPEPVMAAKRGYLTKTQKVARWEALGGRCTVCGELCEPHGPTVIWDHRDGVWFGQSSNPEDFDVHHNTKACAKAKTAEDAKVRGHIKRIIKKNTEPRPPGKIKSRGFDNQHRPFPKGRGFQKGKGFG